MITRIIEKNMVSFLFHGKTIILYGARQVGKTTLIKKILRESNKNTKFFDAESIITRQLFRAENFEAICKSIEGFDIVAIDEAQKIENIGSILKLIHDHIPKIQIIATGSSSFDLAQKTRESMAGRVREFFMTPFLTMELLNNKGYSSILEQQNFLLQYGFYPTAFEKSGGTIEENLSTLAGSLLYKDILELENIRKSQIIIDLLTLLALQIGSEVSYSELAQKLGINIATVQKYCYLLEESFIIFTLRAFNRNIRNEIHKSQKIYFYDIGIRNALIRNFNPPNLRTDIGGLWENFIIAERVKYNKSCKYLANSYFWRTHDQKEIDYIEEIGGFLHAFEIKWNNGKTPKLSSVFKEAYPEHTFSVINQNNWLEVCGERKDS